MHGGGSSCFFGEEVNVWRAHAAYPVRGGFESSFGFRFVVEGLGLGQPVWASR